VFIGGTETYGKFIAEPFPDLAARALGQNTINLGCVNAGLDAITGDRSVLDLAARARVTVIQAIGALNQSNRFYTVHPRRNDRFLAALPPLQQLFPDLDFTEFAFTRHLLSALRARSPERFGVVASALRSDWVKRMRSLLVRAGSPTVLLWLSHRTPSQDAADLSDTDPLLVDGTMIDQVRAAADHYVEVVPTAAACGHGGLGMVCSPMEVPAAAALSGIEAHGMVRDALVPILGRYLPPKERANVARH
jgi:hypothetical protein